MQDQDNKPKKQDTDKKDKRVFPEENTYTPKPDDTSMSSGNLVNNPMGRARTRDLHTKISITGSDDDGQAD